MSLDTKYEYRQVSIKPTAKGREVGQTSIDIITPALNKLGEDRWQMAHVLGADEDGDLVVILMRERTTLVIPGDG